MFVMRLEGVHIAFHYDIAQAVLSIAFACPQVPRGVGYSLTGRKIVSKIIETALNFVKGSTPVVYHTAIIALSAGIAFSLPFAVSVLGKYFWEYWSLVEGEKLYLLTLEIAVAALLILVFTYLRRSWKDRRLSQIAHAAGLIYFTSRSRPLARKRSKRLKERQGLYRDVLFIGSTGFRTLVDPTGDLHRVIQNCREAKVLLLNPCSEGAIERAKGILDPRITSQSLKDQVARSIEFLKGVKEVRKNIALKLYPDAPFLKLIILGDYLWVQHYHAGLDIQMMPEYAFRHDQNPGGLYVPFYLYFLQRWNCPAIPEYDFDTDELVYRDLGGHMVKRERFSR